MSNVNAYWHLRVSGRFSRSLFSWALSSIKLTLEEQSMACELAIELFSCGGSDSCGGRQLLANSWWLAVKLLQETCRWEDTC